MRICVYIFIIIYVLHIYAYIHMYIYVCIYIYIYLTNPESMLISLSFVLFVKGDNDKAQSKEQTLFLNNAREIFKQLIF